MLYTVNPINLETGSRPNHAGSPYTLLLRIEAIGFPTCRLLLYTRFGLGVWSPDALLVSGSMVLDGCKLPWEVQGLGVQGLGV